MVTFPLDLCLFASMKRVGGLLLNSVRVPTLPPSRTTLSTKGHPFGNISALFLAPLFCLVRCCSLSPLQSAPSIPSSESFPLSPTNNYVLPCDLRGGVLAGWCVSFHGTDGDHATCVATGKQLVHGERSEKHVNLCLPQRSRTTLCS